MNPIGIVAGSIAACQAVDCLASLLSVLEDLENAPEDIASLKSEVSSIRITLEKVQALASTGAIPRSLPICRC